MNTLQVQFSEMLQRGRLPYLEYPVIINGENDWLSVEITCLENGFEFSFDSHNLPVFFDGLIVQISDNYFSLPFDSYNAGENDRDDLDYYLVAIAENIKDGFIYANGIQDDSEE
jgi:hypothetical protein